MEIVEKLSLPRALEAACCFMLGDRQDVVDALVLAGAEARRGCYDECCIIYVLRLPCQSTWSVVGVPDGEYFSFSKRAILRLRVKSDSWGSQAEEHARIQENIENAYIMAR